MTGGQAVERRGPRLDHHPLVEKRLADGSFNVKIQALRCFFTHVLNRSDFDLKTPTRRPRVLPQAISRSEVKRILEAAALPRHRVMLMMTYGVLKV